MILPISLCPITSSSSDETLTPLINEAESSQSGQNYESTTDTTGTPVNPEELLRQKIEWIQVINSKIINANKCMVFIIFFTVSAAHIAIPNNAERSESLYASLALSMVLIMTSLACASKVLDHQKDTFQNKILKHSGATFIRQSSSELA